MIGHNEIPTVVRTALTESARVGHEREAARN